MPQSDSELFVEIGPSQSGAVLETSVFLLQQRFSMEEYSCFSQHAGLVIFVMLYTFPVNMNYNLVHINMNYNQESKSFFVELIFVAEFQSFNKNSRFLSTTVSDNSINSAYIKQVYNPPNHSQAQVFVHFIQNSTASNCRASSTHYNSMWENINMN